MHPATIVTAFVTIFVAELPDKTMLATVVLSARFQRPLPVWIGAAAALTVQMVIAVAAGRLLGLLSDRAVSAAVAVLFGVGSVVLWRSSTSADDEAADAAADADRARIAPVRATPWWHVSASVFAVVFLAEWGDLTQLATASLASRGEALSVFVGATAAMVTVAGIGVVSGQALLRVLPERVLRRVAAGIFAALAVLAVVALIRG